MASVYKTATPILKSSDSGSNIAEAYQGVPFGNQTTSLSSYLANDTITYNSDSNVCARCRGLATTSDHGPPFPLAAPYIGSSNPARIPIEPTLHEFTRQSLLPDCIICVQLLQLMNIHENRPVVLRIWWNKDHVTPMGHYMHSCRIQGEGMGTYLDLNLVSVHDSSAAKVLGNDLGPDFNGIKRWISCHNGHTRCLASVGQSIANLRVIDCKARSLVMLPDSCPYVALSYVWSKTQSISYSRRNKLQLPETLPRTIEDALQVTLKLGIDYLWVDQYCIDQDDADEKKRLISSMDAIYRGAEVTIIAAVGPDSSEGLPGVRRNSRVPSRTVQIGMHRFSVFPDYHQELHQSKWITRGWTYQEERLSQRRIYFLPSQIVLQCASGGFLEALHSPFTALTLSTPWSSYKQPTLGVHPWGLRGNMYGYFQRELTYTSDVLNAVQGVVNSYRYSEQLDGALAHFWGLNIFVLKHLDARSAFIAELLWCVVRRGGFYHAPEQPPREKVVAFPSWSWAAKMAGDMGARPTSLQHKEREGTDPFEPTATLAHCDDITLFFTQNSGVRVSVEDYMLQKEDYLAFRPCFEMTCLSVRGSIRPDVPLDRYETVREESLDFDGQYEELDLDYSCVWARGEASVLVVFLGAWASTTDGVSDEVYQSLGENDPRPKCDDPDASTRFDAYCMLCEQVSGGSFRRFGLWSVGLNARRDADTHSLLHRLLNMRVISSNEQWEKRIVRLV